MKPTSVKRFGGTQGSFMVREFGLYRKLFYTDQNKPVGIDLSPPFTLDGGVMRTFMLLSLEGDPGVYDMTVQTDARGVPPLAIQGEIDESGVGFVVVDLTLKLRRQGGNHNILVFYGAEEVIRFDVDVG